MASGLEFFYPVNTGQLEEKPEKQKSCWLRELGSPDYKSCPRNLIMPTSNLCFNSNISLPPSPLLTSLPLSSLPLPSLINSLLHLPNYWSRNGRNLLDGFHLELELSRECVFELNTVSGSFVWDADIWNISFIFCVLLKTLFVGMCFLPLLKRLI